MSRPEAVACTAEGCDRDRRARGLCKQHYNRARYYGTLPPLAHPGLTPADTRNLDLLMAAARAFASPVWCDRCGLNADYGCPDHFPTDHRPEQAFGEATMGAESEVLRRRVNVPERDQKPVEVPDV